MGDYEKAIEIKEKYLEEDNRELAEVYYRHALALEFSTEKYDDALPALQKAISVLKKRSNKLKQTENADSNEEITKEIKELDELVFDMELKVHK